MTITGELAELGHLGGQTTTEMLNARWRSATKQFYVLEPPGGWDDENRLDLLHEFLCERLADLTDALIAVGPDEVAVLKLTSRIMKNWLIDQARKTDTGRSGSGWKRYSTPTHSSSSLPATPSGGHSRA
ncbi:hypothetical protein ACVGOW_06855 [Pseudonocardia saturnea]